MNVIGFFRSFFDNFGQVVEFVNSPIKALHDYLGIDISILGIFSVGLGAFLITMLTLHLVHLVNPVG